ncbi:hypothetical protein HK405_007695, partial [Cladochytrium tenue]
MAQAAHHPRAGADVAVGHTVRRPAAPVPRTTTLSVAMAMAAAAACIAVAVLAPAGASAADAAARDRLRQPLFGSSAFGASSSLSTTADAALERLASAEFATELSTAATAAAAASSLSPANRTDYAISGLLNVTDNESTLANGHYAGYIPVSSDGTAQMFFWYIPSTNTSSKDLVIWLNGGPGCSSLVGLFEENGPLHVQDNTSMTANPYSWNTVANVLYVEQPVGTGYSYAPELESSEFTVGILGLAATFYTFLNGWYTVFNETKDFDLYIAGESYAGYYIYLKGVSIGNGIISVESQESLKSVVNDFDFLHDSGFFGNDTEALATAGAIAQQCLYATESNYTKISYR